MSPKRKNRYENEPLGGRLDVLFYRLSEATVRMVENKIGIAGLWDGIKFDIEELTHENFTKYAIYDPKEIQNSVWWELAKQLLEASRKKGNM